jgi:hypothetical protein
LQGHPGRVAVLCGLRLNVIFSHRTGIFFLMGLDGVC